VGVLAGSGALASSDQVDGADRIDRDERIVAFGDSLTDGVGGAGENYPTHLSRLLKRDVINAGLPGDTTAQGLRRLAAVLERDRPSLLLLCLGLNDFLQGVPDEEILANLVAMMRLSAQAGVPVLLLAVPRPGDSHAHPLYVEAAARGGAHLDTNAMIRVLRNPALKADLIHPNREGYRAIAEALADRLRMERVS
jgi:acyl-CoA thioesterase I